MKRTMQQPQFLLYKKMSGLIPQKAPVLSNGMVDCADPRFSMNPVCLALFSDPDTLPKVNLRNSDYNSDKFTRVVKFPVTTKIQEPETVVQEFKTKLPMPTTTIFSPEIFPTDTVTVSKKKTSVSSSARVVMPSGKVMACMTVACVLLLNQLLPLLDVA